MTGSPRGLEVPQDTDPLLASPVVAGPAAEPAGVVVLDDGGPAGRRAVEYAGWVAGRLAGHLSVVDLDAEDVSAPEALVDRAAGAEVLIVADDVRPRPGATLSAVAVACVTHARCAVLVVHPDDPRPPLDRPAELVVGVDGSVASSRALAWADRLTRGHGDDLDCVTVLGSPEWVFLPGHRTVDQDVAGALDRAAHAVVGDRRLGVHAFVEHGDPVRALVRRSGYADLVVVGTRRRHHDPDGPPSVALRCAAEAHAPVLVVP